MLDFLKTTFSSKHLWSAFKISSILLISACNKESAIEGYTPPVVKSNPNPPSVQNPPSTNLVGVFSFRNFWMNNYLQNIGNAVVLTPTSNMRWEMLEITGTGRFYLRKQGEMLYLTAGTNNQVSATSSFTSWSVWTLVNVINPVNGTFTGRYYLRNFYTGDYLNNETGSLQVTGINTGWHSAQWIKQ